MSVVITINNAYELQAQFQKHYRDTYTLQAYEEMLARLEDWNDALDKPQPIDVVALACSFVELTQEELIQEYGKFYGPEKPEKPMMTYRFCTNSDEREEAEMAYLEEMTDYEDKLAEYNDTELRAELIATELRDMMVITQLDNGNYLLYE